MNNSENNPMRVNVLLNDAAKFERNIKKNVLFTQDHWLKYQL